jgi:hypothetical protein
VIIEVPEDFFQERLSHVSRERFQFVHGLPLGFQQQRLWEHRMQGTIAAPVHGQFGASGQRLGPGLSWHVWSVSDFGTHSGDLRSLDCRRLQNRLLLGVKFVNIIKWLCAFLCPLRA